MQLIDPALVLHQMKRKKPFQSFDILTEDGERIAVTNRWWFAFNEKYVLVFDDDGKQNRIQFQQISKIEPQDVVRN